MFISLFSDICSPNNIEMQDIISTAVSDFYENLSLKEIILKYCLNFCPLSQVKGTGNTCSLLYSIIIMPLLGDVLP